MTTKPALWLAGVLLAGAIGFALGNALGPEHEPGPGSASTPWSDLWLGRTDAARAAFEARLRAGGDDPEALAGAVLTSMLPARFREARETLEAHPELLQRHRSLQRLRQMLTRYTELEAAAQR